VVEGVRLRVVCKALRGVVDECPTKLGRVYAEKLKAALTCFPAAQSLDMALDDPLPAAKEGEWVEMLRKHGATLKRVTPDDLDAEQLLWSAVRAGALPKLSYFDLTLADPVHRQLLTDGRLRMVEELLVATSGLGGAEEHLRAFELLRQLSCLRSLKIEGERGRENEVEATFHAFIPPSLKTLTLRYHQAPLLEALLRQLPSMLEASGAGLEEIRSCSDVRLSAESGAGLARVLHTCSATLKTLHISTSNPYIRDLYPAFRAKIAPGLVSCCEGLERLEVPWGSFKSLPPTCPPFTRLIRLDLDEPGTISLTSPVWDRVASGLLPALTELSLLYSPSKCCGAAERGVPGCRVPWRQWRARSGD
jgi:hypothetical protein